LYNFKYEYNKYYKNEELNKWISGSISFWEKSQLSSGAFNDYYPPEHSPSDPGC